MQRIGKNAPGLLAFAGMIVVSVVIMGYTSYRTVHFIQKTLPPESWLLAFFALGAFDAGVLLWIALHTWNAAGEEQRAISMLMIWVDVGGVAITFVIDTVMQAASNGLTGKLEAGWVIVAVIFTGLVIIGNFVAFVLYHLQSPGHKKRVRDEKLRAAIEAKADEMVGEQLEVMAAQLAPRIAADKIKRLGAQYTAGLGHMPQLPSAASARQISPGRKPVQTRLRPLTVPQQVHQTAYNFEVEQRQSPNEAPLRDEITAEQVADIYYQPPAQEQEQEIEVEAEYVEEEKGGLDFLSEKQAVNQPSPIPIRHNGKLVENQTQAHHPS